MAKFKPIRYLRLTGHLMKDGRVRLLPGFLTEDGRRPEPASSAITAELFNEKNDLLLTHRVKEESYCSDPGRLSRTALRADIPFPEGTRSIKIIRHGVVIHELVVSKDAPLLDLRWRPTKVVTGKHVIQWNADHPDRRPLTFFLRYTCDDGVTWNRCTGRLADTAAGLDFSTLPGGAACRIAVVATDGINTTTVESPTFSVERKPCLAIILHPAADSTHSSKEPIHFSGQGFYVEEKKPEHDDLEWSSSLDGRFGSGHSVDARLSTGDHRITLAAGSKGRVGVASIELHVK